MSARGRRSNVKACFQQPEHGGNVHPTILKQARKTGQLNLSNRGLTEVPDTIWRINMDVAEESRSMSLENPDDRWWDQTDLTKLILASNAITDLGDGIQNLAALTVLDVHDNQLQSLPDVIGKLKNLQKLHLGHNGLKSLPESLGELASLRSLHLEHNQLTELSGLVGRLQDLEELDVSNNKLASLPITIGCLAHVMRFNFANNQVKVIPHEIGLMTALRTLDATHNNIHSLPDELGDLSYLEQLYFRHNKLTHLPLLKNCTNIKELHLGNNALKALTVEHLECLQSISVLDLRDNKILLIPDKITLLQELERLDVSNNEISNLPYVLGTLQKLKSIVLDGNPMKSIRRDIVMRGTNELKKYLRSRLEEPVQTTPKKAQGLRQTKGIPSSVFSGEGEEGIDAFTINQTKLLDYSGKGRDKIPEDLWPVAERTGVHVVNFSKNALPEFPKQLGELSNTLTELYLGFNKMTSLDPVLGELTHLLMLDIRNNQINTLPESLNNLQGLREIVISFNRFRTDLPKVLYQMSGLEIILASDNQIQNVDPDGLKGLSRLASLNLQNNDIMHVPAELGLCTQLRALQLEGNPFRQPRSAILSKGTDSLLEYLRDRIVV